MGHDLIGVGLHHLCGAGVAQGHIGAADLAKGDKDGYTIRYTITPGAGGPAEEDPIKAETFSLSSSPKEYGKTGRRSFFLDSSGILRGADKQGGIRRF